MECANELTYHSTSGDETKCVLFSDTNQNVMTVEILNSHDFEICMEDRTRDKDVKFNVDCQLDMTINGNDNPEVYKVFKQLFMDLKDLYTRLGNKIDNHINIISHRASYGINANEIDFYLDEENKSIKVVFKKKKPRNGLESNEEIGSSVYIPVMLHRTGFVTNIFEDMFNRLKVAIEEETKDVSPKTMSFKPSKKEDSE